jgi:hypothetical protein
LTHRRPYLQFYFTDTVFNLIQQLIKHREIKTNASPFHGDVRVNLPNFRQILNLVTNILVFLVISGLGMVKTCPDSANRERRDKAAEA